MRKTVADLKLGDPLYYLVDGQIKDVKVNYLANYTAGEHTWERLPLPQGIIMISAENTKTLRVYTASATFNGYYLNKVDLLPGLEERLTKLQTEIRSLKNETK